MDPILKAIGKKLKEVKGAIGTLGLKRNPTLKVIDEAIVIDDEWYIHPVEADGEPLRWQASVGYVVHGGREEPDDYDYKELGEASQHIGSALTHLLKEMVVMPLEYYFQALGEAQAYKEEQEMYNDMAESASRQLDYQNSFHDDVASDLAYDAARERRAFGR